MGSQNENKLMKFVVRMDITKMIARQAPQSLIQRERQDPDRYVFFANSLEEFLATKHLGSTGQEMMDNKILSCAIRYNEWFNSTTKTLRYLRNKAQGTAINSYYNG